eukprot:scaffold312142_cov29-Prasinocladus_malaysianus.AAC.1
MHDFIGPEGPVGSAELGDPRGRQGIICVGRRARPHQTSKRARADPAAGIRYHSAICHQQIR